MHYPNPCNRPVLCASPPRDSPICVTPPCSLFPCCQSLCTKAAGALSGHSSTSRNLPQRGTSACARVQQASDRRGLEHAVGRGQSEWQPGAFSTAFANPGPSWPVLGPRISPPLPSCVLRPSGGFARFNQCAGWLPGLRPRIAMSNKLPPKITRRPADWPDGRRAMAPRWELGRRIVFCGQPPVVAVVVLAPLTPPSTPRAGTAVPIATCVPRSPPSPALRGLPSGRCPSALTDQGSRRNRNSRPTPIREIPPIPYFLGGILLAATGGLPAARARHMQAAGGRHSQGPRSPPIKTFAAG